MRKYHTQYSTKISAIEKEAEFYEHNSNCPSCNQTLSDELKTVSIEKLNESRSKLDVGVSKAVDSIAELEEQLKTLECKMEQSSEAEGSLRALQRDLTAANGITAGLHDEIAKLHAMKNQVVEDLNDLRKTLNVLSTAKGKIFDHQLLLNDVGSLLRDDGIKAIIINKYIPVLNQLISKNLEMLEFPCKFVFDQDFSEIIKSRGRDLFSYNSFSEGEKIRIDVALLFAFKELAQMKNSLNTNLLILDEADQGNLDNEGVTGFLKMIREQKKSNIFIISHLPEVLSSKVDKLLTYEKVGNFSQLTVTDG
jgi:DNA repair exonuclease SbcCD ATPase subunit